MKIIILILILLLSSSLANGQEEIYGVLLGKSFQGHSSSYEILLFDNIESAVVVANEYEWLSRNEDGIIVIYKLKPILLEKQIEMIPQEKWILPTQE